MPSMQGSAHAMLNPALTLLCMQEGDAAMRAVTRGQKAVLDVVLNMVEVPVLVLRRVE